MLPVLRKIFLFFGAVVFSLLIFLPGYTKLQELRDKNISLEAKIRRLKIENSLLEEELKRLEDDPVYQEKVAREKMGVVRRGEVPIKIIPEE